MDQVCHVRGDGCHCHVRTLRVDSSVQKIFHIIEWRTYNRLRQRLASV